MARAECKSNGNVRIKHSQQMHVNATRDRVDSIDANDPLLASAQTRWAHLQQPRKSRTGVLL
jgi:hypothetical protein